MAWAETFLTQMPLFLFCFVMLPGEGKERAGTLQKAEADFRNQLGSREVVITKIIGGF